MDRHVVMSGSVVSWRLDRARDRLRRMRAAMR